MTFKLSFRDAISTWPDGTTHWLTAFHPGTLIIEDSVMKIIVKVMRTASVLDDDVTYCPPPGTSSPYKGSVPIYKFQSTEGWMVRSFEAKKIAQAVTLLVAEDPVLLAQELGVDRETVAGFVPKLTAWAHFNRLAADSGGYTVS